MMLSLKGTAEHYDSMFHLPLSINDLKRCSALHLEPRAVMKTNKTFKQLSSGIYAPFAYIIPALAYKPEGLPMAEELTETLVSLYVEKGEYTE